MHGASAVIVFGVGNVVIAVEVVVVVEVVVEVVMWIEIAFGPILDGR